MTAALTIAVPTWAATDIISTDSVRSPRLRSQGRRLTAPGHTSAGPRPNVTLDTLASVTGPVPVLSTAGMVPTATPRRAGHLAEPGPRCATTPSPALVALPVS